MGSSANRRPDLNDLPRITPRNCSGAMRGIVMMLAASLLVTANDALVKLAIDAAGSAEGLLALLIYTAIRGQSSCLLPRCWQLSVSQARIRAPLAS